MRGQTPARSRPTRLTCALWIMRVTRMLRRRPVAVPAENGPDPMLILSRPPAEQHSLIEDVLGILVGATLVALSVQFLNARRALHGPDRGARDHRGAGLGLDLRHAVLRVEPAVLCAGHRAAGLAVHDQEPDRGHDHVGACGCVSAVFSPSRRCRPRWVQRCLVCLPARGFLALFRHGATLGGIGVVALWLQDRNGIPAGRTQLGFDVCVFAVALFLFDWQIVLWSLLGAAILNPAHHRQPSARPLRGALLSCLAARSGRGFTGARGGAASAGPRA